VNVRVWLVDVSGVKALAELSAVVDGAEVIAVVASWVDVEGELVIVDSLCDVVFVGGTVVGAVLVAVVCAVVLAGLLRAVEDVSRVGVVSTVGALGVNPVDIVLATLVGVGDSVDVVKTMAVLVSLCDVGTVVDNLVVVSETVVVVCSGEPAAVEVVVVVVVGDAGGVVVFTEEEAVVNVPVFVVNELLVVDSLCDGCVRDATVVVVALVVVVVVVGVVVDVGVDVVVFAVVSVVRAFVGVCVVDVFAVNALVELSTVVEGAKLAEDVSSENAAVGDLVTIASLCEVVLVGDTVVVAGLVFVVGAVVLAGVVTAVDDISSVVVVIATDAFGESPVDIVLVKLVEIGDSVDVVEIMAVLFSP
jgi:hypothetical protein